MKRFILLIAISLCFSSFFNDLKSNPIIVLPPQAFISELVFNPSHQWTLELEMFIDQYMQVNGAIDSIVLKSNSSRAKLISFPLEHYILFTITSANLNGPFILNYLQDTLRVITYGDSSQSFLYGNPVNTHMLVFGYTNCEIPVLLDGQSICAREKEHGNPRYFYLDNSPTIGIENDTIGATITLTGNFYDIRNILIDYTPNQHGFALQVNADPCMGGYPPQSYFCLLDWFTFNQQGQYSTSLLSRNGKVDNISYLYWNGSPYGYSSEELLPCEHFSFFLEPGGSITHDIHLTDSSFLVGTHEIPANLNQKISVICAPNPVSETGTFFISSSEPLENAALVIHSANGSKVLTLPVPPLSKSMITFTHEQLGAPGLYIFTLLQNSKPVKTGEILCQ